MITENLNLICWCSICHRQIHYGLKEQRRQMMIQIHASGYERLLHSGINVSKQEFVDLALNA